MDKPLQGLKVVELARIPGLVGAPAGAAVAADVDEQ